MIPNPFSTNDQSSCSATMRCLLVMAMVSGTFGFANYGAAQTDPVPATETTGRTAEAVAARIEFASLIFDFGKLSQGEVVRHDFVFTNTGTATLEISSVNPGCGCTTAGNWDRRVEPGRTGIIPLQLNSSSFSGPISKAATVISNDPLHPKIELQIKGTVWKSFEVTPARAVFMVSSEAEANETKVVRIVSQLEEPVTLSDVEGAHPSFHTELVTVKAGREFELRITALPPFASPSVIAPFTVKTSSSATPTINVTAQLVVQQPVVVLPNRITLPAGPLAKPISSVVNIRNNGTTALTLSDARVSMPGAEVRVQEIQFNRQFRVTVQFPAGFEVRPEDVVEVSVKSNHPKFPVIRVPIVAGQRPLPPSNKTVNSPVTRVAPGVPTQVGPK